MTFISTYWQLIFKGLQTTTAAWLWAGSTSLLVGCILGILSCNHLALRKTRFIIGFYTFIVKGIPAYVHILIAYFVVPSVLPLSLSGFSAATSALAFCSAGYVTEIVRSGINAIPTGQWQAAEVLGYSTWQTIYYIIAPQAFYVLISPLMGELEQLLKSTSLLGTIGVMELTRAGVNIISRELNPLPVYLLIACIYLVFSALLSFVLFCIERSLTRRGYC